MVFWFRGFSVVLSELVGATAMLRELSEQLGASPATGYGIDQRAVGHQALATAVTDVQSAGWWAHDVVCGNTNTVADRLSETADGYLSFDQNTADSLAGPDAAPLDG